VDHPAKEDIMLSMWTALKARYIEEEEGASIVEYALLVALIAVVAIIAVTFVGDQVSQQFSDIGSGLGSI
jgi:pilus assembly protein Flp/PilA